MLTIISHILLMLGAMMSPASGHPEPKQDIQIVDYDGLEKYLARFQDKTVVVNFWATWCVPCVKELPYFEQVTATYPEDQVVVVLVSLDFTSHIEKKLKPFLAKHDLASRVIVLDDPDQNVWIDKVDPRWSGAIPVTVVRKGTRQEFYEKAFHSYEELDTIIQSFIKS